MEDGTSYGTRDFIEPLLSSTTNLSLKDIKHKIDIKDLQNIK
jgi:hypothetical protein